MCARGVTGLLRPIDRDEGAADRSFGSLGSRSPKAGARNSGDAGSVGRRCGPDSALGMPRRRPPMRWNSRLSCRWASRRLASRLRAPVDSLITCAKGRLQRRSSDRADLHRTRYNGRRSPPGRTGPNATVTVSPIAIWSCSLPIKRPKRCTPSASWTMPFVYGASNSGDGER